MVNIKEKDIKAIIKASSRVQRIILVGGFRKGDWGVDWRANGKEKTKEFKSSVNAKKFVRKLGMKFKEPMFQIDSPKKQGNRPTGYKIKLVMAINRAAKKARRVKNKQEARKLSKSLRKKGFAAFGTKVSGKWKVLNLGKGRILR